MAAAKICDACGEFYKYVDNENNENGIEIQHMSESGIMQRSIKKYELCPDCMAKIHTAINNN